MFNSPEKEKTASGKSKRFQIQVQLGDKKAQTIRPSLDVAG